MFGSLFSFCVPAKKMMVMITAPTSHPKPAELPGEGAEVPE
jgi:hypothetical protein